MNNKQCTASSVFGQQQAIPSMIERDAHDAILAWISTVESTAVKSSKDLWKGDIIYSLMKKIEHFDITEFKESSEEDSWTLVLTNIKRLHKDLEDYYLVRLHKTSFDNTFCNVLLFAQNKDPEQIFNFCLQLLGAAVQAPNKEMFISAILMLSPDHQSTLMNLIQKFKFFDSEESIIKEVGEKKETERDVLLAKVESLENENEKLEKQVEAILTTKGEQEKKYKRLEDEYSKMRKEFDEKMEELDNQPKHAEEAATVIQQDMNNILVEQLKQKLLQLTVANNKEKAELQDTIDFLKEKLQKKDQEIEHPQRSSTQPSINSMSVPEHPPCISLSKHQQLLLGQSVKIKEMTKKELDLQIESINMKKEVQQLQKQMERMKVDFIKKSDAINRDDYEAVKLNVLSLLRDKLKMEGDKLTNK